MGTTYHVTLVTDTSLEGPEVLQAKIDAALAELNQQMSTYIPDSEINSLKQAPVGQWQDISKPLMEVLKISQAVSGMTSGAFDVTVRPLIDLWGFGPEESLDRVPPPEALSQVMAQMGYQSLQLDVDANRLKRQKLVDLDLSAVAKGYGVDLVAKLLETSGISDYLVEIGGEMRLSGHNPKGQSWRVAIEKPDAGLVQSVYRIITLSDSAVATSGDYRNFFVKDGVRYSHTVDPRTGYPITHNLVSVTVLHPEAAWADALATAFNVMGADDALRLANSEGIAALFIIKRNDGIHELVSEAFKPFLQG